MTTILITGAGGFLGRNLVARLENRSGYKIYAFNREGSEQELRHYLETADIVFHLAGINRADRPADYDAGNYQFTARLCAQLQSLSRSPTIVFASSIQAASKTAYGLSKKKAEEALQQLGAATCARIRIYRLKNLFGKWGRPDYNSVTVTFCYRIARDLPITISDPDREIELTYVDDVVRAFEQEIENCAGASTDLPSTVIGLGDLAGRLQAFHAMRETLRVADMKDYFTRCLFSTYQSYVPPSDRCWSLPVHADARGILSEFVKSEHFGQIFLSRTRPGVTRGNHFHQTKTEKFLVVDGRGVIRLRPIHESRIEEYEVSGSEFRVVDIPPGFTHSITNVGTEDMLTLFWSGEIFDPDWPDTYYLPVCTQPDARREVIHQ